MVKYSDISDPLFREALLAIDNGNPDFLQQTIISHPFLVSNRLDFPQKGYFKEPYLLWFVANNPIRNEKLPANILSVISILIKAVKQYAAESFQFQIDYALGLIATGRVPRESGMQNEMMDLLIHAGAEPGNGHAALANGNKEAARHLIKRGGAITLTTALCLDLKEDIDRLSKQATETDKEIALMAAAFFGNADKIKFLLQLKVNVNAWLNASSGFHSHAAALHQAVYSGSLESVQLLVEAGADLNAKDKIYDGTALEWSDYMHREERDETMKIKYAAIENYLSTVS